MSIEVKVTYQSDIHGSPVVKTFDTREEADQLILLLKDWVEEKRIGWKIPPTVEVGQ